MLREVLAPYYLPALVDECGGVAIGAYDRIATVAAALSVARARAAVAWGA